MADQPAFQTQTMDVDPGGTIDSQCIPVEIDDSDTSVKHKIDFGLIAEAGGYTGGYTEGRRE